MENERILGALPSGSTEKEIEVKLRPQHVSEFVGQSTIIEKLKIFVQAARNRGEPLDHVLFYGPPGLGKTTLATIIANEMGSNMKSTSGPIVERKDDLAAILSSLEPRDVLFIDEIHRLNRTVEECLYPALEDRKIDILINPGPHAKSVPLSLSPFTLVGATTRAGMLSGPLRTRFGISLRLDFYAPEELARIITRSAGIMNVPIEPDGAVRIAQRSRGTPRIANRILRRVRDIAEVLHDGRVTAKVAEKALVQLDLDAYGLDQQDRAFLRCLIEKFNGRPVGIGTLAVALSEDEDTLMDVVEPYLIQVGFLTLTPRGRMATPSACKHLGLPVPASLLEPITPEEMLANE